MSFILYSSLSSTKIHQTLSHWRTIGPSCMCIASARHEQPKQDKVVSKRSSWHRRSNLWHWILDQTNITNSSDLPDQICEGILAGARHGKTKRNTGIMLCAACRLYRKKKQQNMRVSVACQKHNIGWKISKKNTLAAGNLKSLTSSHKGAQTDQVQTRPPQRHGTLHFMHEEPPKKTQKQVQLLQPNSGGCMHPPCPPSELGKK